MSPAARATAARGLTRARDADRDAALLSLREAMADGQLTEDEFDTRMAAVLSATRVGELASLTDDLQKPPPQAIVSIQPRWVRLFGPLIIVLVVALVLAGIEGLTRLGGSTDGIDTGSDGGMGFPSLHFPGSPAVHTAAGMTALIAAVEEQFGTTSTLRVVVYPEYAVIWMPQQADPTRVDTYYYDGNFDDASPAGTRDPAEEPLFDLADLDVDAYALLILQTPEAVGISEPETIYAVIDVGYDSGEAVLGIYASDAYVSGHVNADLTGTVKDVNPAS